MTRETTSVAELTERFKKSRRSSVAIGLLNDVLEAARQLESGQGVSNPDAKAELRRRLKR